MQNKNLEEELTNAKGRIAASEPEPQIYQEEFVEFI